MSVSDQTIDRNLLRKFSPITDLPEARFDELVSRIYLEDFDEGFELFKENSRDPYCVYLVEGKIALLSDSKEIGTITAGSSQAMLPIDEHQPRKATAIAKTDIVLIRVDRDFLNILLSHQDASDYEVSDLDSLESDDWMTQVLQSPTFQHIPASNVMQAMMQMEQITVSKGEVIVKQGDAGDFFYMIHKGKAQITRVAKPNKPPMKLGELRSGECFGEDALISDSKRNATITMLTDGKLLRLAREPFISLVKDSLLRYITFKEAVKLENAIWIDCREQSEYLQSHIKGSKNIPFVNLRLQIESLDIEQPYIIYCQNTYLSSAAAFLLSERGFEASALRDGLSKVPQDALESEQGTSSDDKAVSDANDMSDQLNAVYSEHAGVDLEQLKILQVELDKANARAEKFEREAKTLKQGLIQAKQQLRNQQNQKEEVAELKEQLAALNQELAENSGEKNFTLQTLLAEMEEKLKSQAELMEELDNAKDQLQGVNEELAESLTAQHNLREILDQTKMEKKALEVVVERQTKEIEELHSKLDKN